MIFTVVIIITILCALIRNTQSILLLKNGTIGRIQPDEHTWATYTSVFGDKTMTNTFINKDLFIDAYRFELAQYHDTDTQHYKIACTTYTSGQKFARKEREQSVHRGGSGTLDHQIYAIDKENDRMCFVINHDTLARNADIFTFVLALLAPLKIHTSVYELIESIRNNDPLPSALSEYVMHIYYHNSTIAAHTVEPSTLEASTFSFNSVKKSLQNYLLTHFENFYWSSDDTASASTSDAGKTDGKSRKEAWTSMNSILNEYMSQSSGGVTALASSTVSSTNDPCNIKSLDSLEFKDTGSIITLSLDKFFASSSSNSNQMNAACFGHLSSTFAQIPSIKLISLVTKTKILNYRARSIQQSYTVGVDAGSCPYTKAGLKGDNQIASVIDTGVDDMSCYFYDSNREPIQKSSYRNPIFDSSYRKIIQYSYNPGGGDTSDEVGGHGTHVAGTIVGFAGNSDESSGSSMYDGVAPNAKLIFLDCAIGNGGLSVPSGTDMYDSSYNNGARVHSNSWGAYYGSSGYYASAVIDKYLYDHPQLSIFFAAGNSGQAGSSSVSMDASAKNVITVGSSDIDSSPYAVSWFSSIGPTYDGRIKPDIIAPGNSLNSAMSNGAGGPSCNNINMIGTSMATPAAAGIALLIRQYFTDNQFWANICGSTDAFCRSFDPSGVLIKTLLMHSGSQLNGVAPDSVQGHGLVTLKNVLPLQGYASFYLFVEDLTSIQESSEISYQFTVVDQSIPLKVTIAWYDAPAAETSTSSALVNDLDLIASSPSGSQYYGNNIQSDRVNNNEQIYINNPELGIWSISVSSFALPYTGSQVYSISVSCGGSSSSSSSSNDNSNETTHLYDDAYYYYYYYYGSNNT